MRKRLRELPSEDELKTIYAIPHDANKWKDHKIRCDMTVTMGMHLPMTSTDRIADLSCGNGYIATSLATLHACTAILGDFAQGYEFTGPIERTIDEIADVDLFVCSETVEHLDNPDEVLKKIRMKSAMLLLSTPIARWDDSNREHLWAWDISSVRIMLLEAGWNPLFHTALMLADAGYYYDYQIWACT